MHTALPDPSRRRLVLAPLLAGLPSLGLGAEGEPVGQLRGRTLDGQDFDLDRLRGRVVMVVLWRTDCAVCLDKMPELRANARGWKGKPFDLVTVNVDEGRSDVERYDALRRQTGSRDDALYALWQGQATLPPAWRSAGRLPLSLVIDRQGRVAARYEGRIPAEAWDAVADLLP